MNHHPFRNYLLNKAASLFPLPLLRDKDSIFPVYHSVSDLELIHIKHLYRIKNVNTFKKDLDFFLKNYKAISLAEILECFEKNLPLPKDSFHITFDDGLAEVNNTIAPILLQKGIPATFFLNTAFIDNKDLFFRYKASILIERLDKLKNRQTIELLVRLFGKKGIETPHLKDSFLSVNYLNRDLLDSAAMILNIDFSDYLQKEKPYLSSEEIEDLIKLGFTFGAHSIDHPRFSDITLDDQLLQTNESLNFICHQFKIDYRVFGFPFGEEGISNEYFEKSKLSVDCFFGSAGMKKEKVKNILHRIEMEDTSIKAADTIKTAYLKKKINLGLGRNIIYR